MGTVPGGGLGTAGRAWKLERVSRPRAVPCSPVWSPSRPCAPLRPLRQRAPDPSIPSRSAGAGTLLESAWRSCQGFGRAPRRPGSSLTLWRGGCSMAETAKTGQCGEVTRCGPIWKVGWWPLEIWPEQRGDLWFSERGAVVKQLAWSGVYAAFEKCSGHLCGQLGSLVHVWGEVGSVVKHLSFEHTYTACFCATSLPPPDVLGLREGPLAPTLTSLDSKTRPESTLFHCPLG